MGDGSTTILSLIPRLVLSLTHNYLFAVLTSSEQKALLTQQQISTIQNTRGITYAGAWLKYGFHEDGFTSGLLAVHNHLPGIRPPFTVRSADRTPLPQVRLELFFEFMESTSARAWIEWWLGLWLSIFRFWLGFVFDLSHLREERKASSASKKMS